MCPHLYPARRTSPHDYYSLTPQDKQGEKDFGSNCRDEVKRYENEISKDYRLNFRLRTACQTDVQALCPSTCSLNDGQVSCRTMSFW